MSGTKSSWATKASAAPAFAGLTPDDLARLFGAAVHQQARDAQTLFARGDAADKVYLILAGSVRVSTMAASGKRITVEIFQRDDIFGEVAAIDDGPRSADTTAMGPVEVIGIPVAVFREVLARSAPLANNLLRLATRRLRRTYSLLEDASLRSVEVRLAKQVLYLTRLGGEGRARPQVRMQQDDLADLLGVTTRSIINVLNKWRADGLVTFDGRTAQLTILDIGAFGALTDD